MMNAWVTKRQTEVCMKHVNAWTYTRSTGNGALSRPKPDTRICDHDRYANIKPKPDINKNQLNFYQNFYKSFPYSFHSCFFTS